MKSKNLRVICEGAIMVAMAVVLNLIRLPSDWLSGTGGSIELTMLPIIVFALRRGTGWGIGAGLVFGVLKGLLGSGVAYGWQAMLLDYAAAFAVVGLAGLFPRRKALGAFVGSVARLAVHIISGVVLCAQWMPEKFMGLHMTSPWTYSFLYNGPYMLANTVLAVTATMILAKTTHLLERQTDA